MDISNKDAHTGYQCVTVNNATHAKYSREGFPASHFIRESDGLIRLEGSTVRQAYIRSTANSDKRFVPISYTDESGMNGALWNVDTIMGA